MALDLKGPNKWRRVYFNSFTGNPNNRKIKAPLIEPFELPLIFDSHVLAISASYAQAPPKWRTAGYLNQTYSGIDLAESPITDTVGSPTAGVDVVNERIRLNTFQMIRFPQLASDFYLWFDPVYWMPKLTLAIWEFQGTQPIDLEDSMRLARLDLTRIEFKIDEIEANHGQ